MGIMAVLFGIADGVIGVFSNAFLPAVTGAAERSGVIATVGVTRNLGEAVGPGVVGAALLVVDLRWSLVLLGMLAILTVIVLAPLARQDHLIMRGDG